jgi:hypothetical protein
MFFLSRFVTILLISLTAAGCGAHTHDEAVVHDAATATSDDGLVVISYATEAPLARSGNVFKITLASPADGTPFTAAVVGLEVSSEAGSSVGTFAAAEAGEGLHRAPPVDFPASGSHLIKVHVSRAADGLHDHATFRVGVP